MLEQILVNTNYSNHSWVESVDPGIILQGKESDLRIKKVF